MNICSAVFQGLLLWYVICFKATSLANETNSNDDDISQKPLIKCNKIVNSSLLTPCVTRIRLLHSYNTLRSKIASGQFHEQPTIGNMLRVKWLLSVEAHIHGPVSQCSSSLPAESNVTIQGDPYNSNYTYTCDVIYVRRLFREWFLEEIVDYMIEASFSFNFFGDFDENGSYKRISLEGFGCSIILNRVGFLTTEAFMGCGFCTSPPITKPAFNAKPCSVCDPIPNNYEAIPSSCDYYFRSLCYARNSKIDRSEVYADYYLMNRETGCDAQSYFISVKRKFIPRQIEASPVIFYKITHLLPMLTIGLLVYYMAVVKKQGIRAIKIPRQLTKEE